LPRGPGAGPAGSLVVWLNRLLLASLLAGAIAYLPRHVGEGSSSEDLARVQEEREQLEQGNAALRREIELLEAEVSALHRDPEDPHARGTLDAEIERIAREDLNLIRPGEVVFEVETKKNAKGAARP
jgi:cell division protein FtsB